MSRLKFQIKSSNLVTRLLAGAMLFATPLIVGCNSGSNSDDGTSFNDIFVASEDTVGRIDIDLNSSNVQVSDTIGYSVAVRNQDGQAVPGISVFCDSEAGLAVIEPTTGQTLTNQFGEISGVLGCEAPGSFQFGCRLPSGTNLRQFVQVLCEGTIPAGFSGFGDASGGGGLGNGSGGGGVDVGEDGDAGGTGTEGIRLTEIAANDTGDGTAFSNATFSIDSRMVNCELDPEADASCEPFFDSVLSFRIINNSNQFVQITGYNYTIPNANGSGASFTSQTIAPTSIEGSGTVSAFGGDLAFSALFAEVISGSAVCGAEKRFAGASASMPTDLGFRNVTVRVFGRNESGDQFTVSGRLGLSFDNFDRCNG